MNELKICQLKIGCKAELYTAFSGSGFAEKLIYFMKIKPFFLAGVCYNEHKHGCLFTGYANINEDDCYGL